ncbi:MAG: MFS transporter, partial [Coriobacteriales bacterium]
LFIAATAVASVSPNFQVLLICRLLQGIGTGIGLPLMMNIVLEQAPYEKMGTMMGIAMFITAIAPAVGPSLGGYIVTNFGWRMIFTSLLPLLIVAAFIGAFSIRQASPVHKFRFTWVDWILLACAFTCLVIDMSYMSSWGIVDPRFLSLLAGLAVFLVLFVRHTRSEATPLVNLQTFKCKPFFFSMLAIVLLQSAVLGLGFLIPNCAQIVWGQTALVAGCLLLPGCIVGGAMAPLSGRIMDKLGAMRPILTGSGLLAIATVIFAIFFQGMDNNICMACYTLFAFGQSTCVGNMLTNGIRQLPEDQSADGNAIINTFQQLAGAIGTAIASTIVGSYQSSLGLVAGTSAGTQTAFVVFAVIGICVFLSAAASFRSKRVREQSQTSEMARES